MDTILNFFLQHKFNTVRIPVSVAFGLAPKDFKPNQRFVGKGLKGKTIWEILDEVIDQAALRGLMVMLDMHTLGPQDATDLWYDEQYKEADILQAWSNIMAAYSIKWNVFALDLKNEPHGILLGALVLLRWITISSTSAPLHTFTPSFRTGRACTWLRVCNITKRQTK